MERGCMPSARPVTVGRGRLSICLTLYPHRDRHRESKRPTGPAPTITISYLFSRFAMDIGDIH